MTKIFYLIVTLMFVTGCDKFLTSNSNNDDLNPRTCSSDKALIADNAGKNYEWQKQYYKSDPEALRFTTPTKKLNVADHPYFLDDIDFNWFELALERQLKRFVEKRAKGHLDGTIELGGEKYPLTRVVDSLEFMLDLIRETARCLSGTTADSKCYDMFTSSVSDNFDVFVPDLKPGDPRYGEPNPVLYTAYYTPVIRGSLEPTSQTPYPIYKRPRTEALRKKTRLQIDFQGAFEKKGLELFYAPDFFELYLLHVEGGGKVIYQDENKAFASIYLSYDGHNSQKWRFISRHMKEKGYISNGSIAAQRAYLEAHPEKWEEIYSTCPSYVYFKPTEHPPLGNDEVSLTDRRSIALDSRLYNFKGMLTFVKSRRPVENWRARKGRGCGEVPFRDFSRFFLDQDTGGAIRGKGRGDLYFGESPYAKFASALMKERGELYFLILRESAP